ncbi:RDD family protein [Isoptericola variabilis]|uniref:RDD domain containing protein n=1 Tax=Isoptericola variabilis (strain 225) TaxID=743718 RepID=F6FX08_ISOV2|nr:RDD family protein [Isoptericola variabilis]AEG44608.1 RDD domain containing protein [Isoptericola variabilis 225]TWH28201.1 RDD family protein [Isoptericola variabilis J7]
MVSREGLGSWLEGGSVSGSETSGSRLGLPESGPGSKASLGRRVVALGVDWVVATLIAILLFRPSATGVFEMVSQLPAWAQPAIFAAMNLLLVSTIGSTIGHRLLGLQVRVLRAGPHEAVGFARGAVRTALLCLVIPAVVWDADGRGLHDRAAGTVIVRR